MMESGDGFIGRAISCRPAGVRRYCREGTTSPAKRWRDWIPLRGESFYSKNDIDLRLDANVASIDAHSGDVALADGGRPPYDWLLLATGAEPVRLTIPGADLPHAHRLGSFADSKAVIERTTIARGAIVLGASFIGLEVAAA